MMPDISRCLIKRCATVVLVAATLIMISHYAHRAVLYDLVSNSDNMAGRIAKYQNVQFALLFSGFFILAVTVFFIFAPMIRRITEQITQLESAEFRANESSRMKSEFIATMSHELRSPMTGILGMAELLSKTEMNEEQCGYVNTIERSGDGQLNIIEDILDFARLEKGEFSLHDRPLDLQEVMDDLCALYYQQAREKAVELIVRYAPGSQRLFISDSARLRQIFGNLIHNAIKFTERGYILIDVNQAEPVTDGKTEMIITVRDSGIGIEEDQQDEIFKMFHQVDATSTSNHGGIGMGLSVCQRLVDLMGGRINVESRKAVGTTFKVMIPMRVQDVREDNLNSTFPLQNLKILIVDDLLVMQHVIQEQMVLNGADCRVVSSAADALNALASSCEEQTPFDVIIIDYLMEGLDGEDLAREIKIIYGENSPCMIMLSAARHPPDKVLLGQLGFSAYISKPFKNEKLVSTIANVWQKFNDGDRKSFFHTDGSVGHASCDKNDIQYLKGAEILLAEDSRLNQIYSVKILEGAGANVHIANHGQDAIALLQKQKFDVMLLDCRMPVMDGFETIKHIRAQNIQSRGERSLPVIAMTANAMNGDRDTCLAAGMDDYLAKPVRSDDLLKSVTNYYAPPKSKDECIDNNIHDGAKRLLGEDYERAVKIYMEETEKYIQQISKALDQNNLEDAILPAHTIRSTSRHIGALALAECAGQLEEKCKRAESMTANDLHVYTTRLNSLYRDVSKCF